MTKTKKSCCFVEKINQFKNKSNKRSKDQKQNQKQKDRQELKKNDSTNESDLVTIVENEPNQLTSRDENIDYFRFIRKVEPKLNAIKANQYNIGNYNNNNNNRVIIHVKNINDDNNKQKY